MESLAHVLGAVEPYVVEYGFVAVFLILFLESFGVPLPGESLLVAATLLASRGQMPLVPLVGVAYAASVMGDNVGYAIGRAGGRTLVVAFGGRLGLTCERLRKAEALFARFGGRVVVFARFFAVLRQLNGLVAGTVAMPWRRFVAFNALGAALWVGAWTVGPLLAIRHMERLAPLFGPWGWGAAAAALALLAGAAWLWLRRR